MSVVFAGGLATICLDRPPVNAFDECMVEELDAALASVRASDADLLVVRSAASHFSAGADLKAIAAMLSDAGGVERVVALAAGMQRAFGELEALEMPTIAVLNGAVLGGGLELALACDVRIAASNATFGLPEVGIGVVPAAGATQRVPRLIGYGAAASLLLTGEVINADEALRLGLVQRLFPEGDLCSLADEFVSRIAAHQPSALRAAKRCLRAKSAERGLEAELQASRELYGLPGTTSRIKEFAGAR